MLNYEVPSALLAPLVPAGTELDTWNGATLASMVGFRFLDTRVTRDPDSRPPGLRRGEPPLLCPPARRGQPVAARGRLRARAGASAGDRARGTLVLQRAVLGRAHAPRAPHGRRRGRAAGPGGLRLARRGSLASPRGDNAGPAGAAGSRARKPRSPPSITGATRSSATAGRRNTGWSTRRGGSGMRRRRSSTAMSRRCMGQALRNVWGPGPGRLFWLKAPPSRSIEGGACPSDKESASPFSGAHDDAQPVHLVQTLTTSVLPPRTTW